VGQNTPKKKTTDTKRKQADTLENVLFLKENTDFKKKERIPVFLWTGSGYVQGGGESGATMKTGLTL